MPPQIDAVLTLHGRDLPRAALLARSMKRFVEGIGTLWVVAPEEALRSAEAVFADAGVARCVGIPEQQLIPELATKRIQWRPRLWGATRPGYRAQQLIKLQMALRVETDFYLTLDADVLAVAPIDLEWLLPSGKARTVCFEGQGHANWYATASEILGLPESRWEHGVTPCTLSRDCVRSLLAYLERPQGADREPQITPDAQVRGDWRGDLGRRHDWTEYTLYHTFVEAAGAFDRYHVAVPAADWYGANVWVREDWPLWTPESAFEGERSFRFSVLQSSMAGGAKQLERLVAPYLEST